MGRVIKFRAWDEQNGKMHKDFQFIKSGNDGNDWIIFTSDLQTLQEESPHPLSNPYFQQQFKIMQFTGLHDVNGVEVYEDDIVYVAGLGNAIVRTACHCGVFYETADDYQTYSDCAAEGDYPTVIGNIYQNPELLK